MTPMADAFRGQCTDLSTAFLKLGIMSYGGAAMMGIMHAEVVERRRWLSDERYLEGVGLVSMLPGPPAVQLAVFVGYARAGWRGGILAGICFLVPAFFQLLGLTLLYSAYGSIGAIRGALYGMAPVVLAIFIAAVYRLGRSTLNAPGQVAITVIAGVLVAYSPIGIVATLLAAGCAALALDRFRVQGLVAGLVVIAAFALTHWLQDVPARALVPTGRTAGSVAPSLGELAAFFLKVGAFTFGCLVVTLLQLFPQAAPDVLAIGMLLAATARAIVWRVPPLPLILGGAALGLALRLAV